MELTGHQSHLKAVVSGRKRWAWKMYTLPIQTRAIKRPTYMWPSWCDTGVESGTRRSHAQKHVGSSQSRILSLSLPLPSTLKKKKFFLEEGGGRRWARGLYVNLGSVLPELCLLWSLRFINGSMGTMITTTP